MAFISFTFGLQHAFDVDHITAIDNMTRNLINDGKNTQKYGSRLKQLVTAIFKVLKPQQPIPNCKNKLATQ